MQWRCLGNCGVYAYHKNQMIMALRASSYTHCGGSIYLYDQSPVDGLFEKDE